MDNLAITFFPLLPQSILIALVAVVALLLLTSLAFKREIILSRILLSALFLFYLAGPSLQEETRTPLKDTALIVIDESASQKLGNRVTMTQDIHDHLKTSLEGNESLDYTTTRIGDITQNRTALSGEILKSLENIPQNRRAGIVIITDGQIHGSVTALTEEQTGPVHVFLTGHKKETDRYIELIESPAYGIVGQSVPVRFRIRENPTSTGSSLPVTITPDDGQSRETLLQTEEEHSLTLNIDHPGANFFELSIPAKENELTAVNNKISFSVNGVRDRLKVLLVSGKPHMGERMWRNLLKSDPAVDLVHFTILRQPDKRDNVPQRELSLIPFPFQELFEEKLYDFDLIIFDRYTLNRILPLHYFQNISSYILQGGALMEVSGPEYAGDASIYNTALKSVLPLKPTSNVIEQAFYPNYTQTGQNHPITKEKIGSFQKTGPWLRHVATTIQNEQDRILMTGTDNFPLIVIGEREKGRIAQLASDQIWLWERAYKEGGAHTKLLRRLVHWLMKEPELEEEKISIDSNGQNAVISLRLMNPPQETVTVTLTKPDGEKSEINLTADQQTGAFQNSFLADQPGLYKVSYQNMSAIYAAGDLKSLEFQNVLTTTGPLQDIVKKSGGRFIWTEEKSKTNIRHVEQGRKMSGFGWIGLQKNNSYTIKETSAKPLLSHSAWLTLFLAALLLGWLRESKN